MKIQPLCQLTPPAVQKFLEQNFICSSVVRGATFDLLHCSIVYKATFDLLQSSQFFSLDSVKCHFMLYIWSKSNVASYTILQWSKSNVAPRTTLERMKFCSRNSCISGGVTWHKGWVVMGIEDGGSRRQVDVVGIEEPQQRDLPVDVGSSTASEIPADVNNNETISTKIFIIIFTFPQGL